MGQLIIVLVNELPKAKVEFEGVAVFGGDEDTGGKGDFGDKVEVVVEAEGVRAWGERGWV